MLDLTYLYAHKGKPLRTHVFDEIFEENKIEEKVAEYGMSSPPASHPVVMWRCTRACNLDCVHCYADATPEPALQELSTAESKKMIDDLAGSGVSTLVISGGEPLLRKDLIELIRYARTKEMGVVLSTNGTLLTENIASELKDVGCSYVSISFTGIGRSNDDFHGRIGAFKEAVRGMEAAQKAGLKVVLRYTLTQHTIHDLRPIFKFIQDKNITTVFFYHLFPHGRNLEAVTPALEETHRAVDLILEATKDLNKGSRYVRVFVAGNICDSAYLYKVLIDQKDPKAWRVHSYLTGEGDRFGKKGFEASCIDWNGSVHPNQFQLDKTLGDIRTEKFLDIIKRNVVCKPSDIAEWETTLLERCAQCRYVSLCINGFQPAVLADEELRRSYPKCYLTAAETVY